VQPVLQIAKSGGNVTISWSNGPGFVLQKTTSLGAPVTWTDVGTSNPAVLSIAPDSPQFYRVRQP